MIRQGDYEQWAKGLEGLFRVRDLVDWDILRAEMVAGVSDGNVGVASTPYIILRAHALARGVSIGDPCIEWVAGHVMGYLASAILLQGVSGPVCPLVRTAVEELMVLRFKSGS